MTIYELLCLEPPFNASERSMLYDKILNDEFLELKTENVEKELKELVELML